MTVTQSLDREAMDALVTRARREIDSGLLPSCQLAIAQHGEVVLDVTPRRRDPRHPLRHLLVHEGVDRERDLVAHR